MSKTDKISLFNFPDDVVYFNTASFSPAFKSVSKAGIEAVKRKERPDFYQSSDLFEPVKELRRLFAKLIDVSEVNRVVTIPSVSYGMATAANNITLNKGDEIILVEEQFPSNVYIWKDLAAKYEATITTIKQPKNSGDWNTKILEAITPITALIAIPQIHWASGIIFDLYEIRKKTKAYNALMVVDGSQSVGALPFSIKHLQPDALICAGYKWLFGPYGCAYAYFGEHFDNGKALEQNWANRLGSDDLTNLTTYQSNYKPLAQRYAAGESASFIYIKMQIAALREVLKFQPSELQNYCNDISNKALYTLNEIGFFSENPQIRSKHLFGIKIPAHISINQLKKSLKQANIHLSFRGEYMRVSCHFFNTKAHFDKLVKTVELAIK